MHGGGVDTDKVRRSASFSPSKQPKRLLLFTVPQQNGGDTASLREKVQLRRGEKWRILKNIITVSVAFMVQFTAFQVWGYAHYHQRALAKPCTNVRCFSSHPGHGKSAILDQCKGRARHGVAQRRLRGAGSVLHLSAHARHPQAHREVDAVREHALLRPVHCLAVLSTVLHPAARGRATRPGRCPDVGQQGHLPDAARPGVRQADGPVGRGDHRAVLRVLLSRLANG